MNQDMNGQRSRLTKMLVGGTKLYATGLANNNTRDTSISSEMAEVRALASAGGKRFCS